MTFWWVYFPILLWAGFLTGWEHYTREKYLDSLEWTVLQIKPPPALDRSLKAVEQIFAGLHGIYLGPVSWKDKFFRGKIQDWFSLEIVGSEGVTNFYIRTLSQYRQLVESNIFAQYPDAEISVAEDYMAKWPRYLPNEEIDLFGLELLLAKESAYPIQTYPYFEEKSGPGLGPDPLRRLDPLASFTEIFSLFRPGEDFVIQILIRPTGDGWAKEAQGVIDKIQGKEPKVKVNFLENILQEVDKLFIGASVKKEEKEKKVSAQESEAIKAIGSKTTKLGFETSIRLAYVAKKDVFHRHHFAAITGAFKQLATQHLNSFKANASTITFSKGKFNQIFPSDKGFFADQIAFEKKWKLFQHLKGRTFPNKFFVFNTEELATIYHLPGLEVKAPLFPRVEAKKGQPPSGLPLEL